MCWGEASPPRTFVLCLSVDLALGEPLFVSPVSPNPSLPVLRGPVAPAASRPPSPPTLPLNLPTPSAPPPALLPGRLLSATASLHGSERRALTFPSLLPSLLSAICSRLIPDRSSPIGSRAGRTRPLIGRVTFLEEGGWRRVTVGLEAREDSYFACGLRQRGLTFAARTQAHPARERVA